MNTKRLFVLISVVCGLNGLLFAPLADAQARDLPDFADLVEEAPRLGRKPRQTQVAASEPLQMVETRRD